MKDSIKKELEAERAEKKDDNEEITRQTAEPRDEVDDFMLALAAMAVLLSL